MDDSAFKPKINSTRQDPTLKKAELDFMKIIEQKNLERVEKLKLLGKRNRLTGFAIGAGVFSIYLYSMFAVKQENFLDDFEEPVKIQKD